MRTRLMLGTLGALLGGYGAFRILQQPERSHPTELAKWLVAAVIVHDGVIAPVTIALGFVIATVVRPRARRYLQGALIAGLLMTAVAAPLIYRHGTQPAGTVLTSQDYVAHVAWLWVLIAAGAATAYLVRVVGDRGQRASEAKDRPPTDHDSTVV
jgi:hypothetical protein